MKQNKTKAVLFDLDGVLVDSFRAWYLTYNDTLQHFGRPKISVKRFAKFFGNPVEEDIKRDFKGRTVKEVMEIGYAKHFPKNAKHVELIPNAKHVLARLRKRKLKLGLITNSSRKVTLSVLNRFKIKKYFNTIVTRSDVRRGKPAPDVVIKACRQLKVNPKEAILVGDTVNDIIAGRKAGCFSVGFGVGGDKKIRDLKEICEIANPNHQPKAGGFLASLVGFA